LTDFYVGIGLPRFYAEVIFVPLDEDDFYAGGTSKHKNIRIVARHAARTSTRGELSMSDVEACVARFQEIYAYYFEPKGLDWEFNLDELPRDYWRLNGLVPLPTPSEAQDKWAELNHPAPY
jgi:hypothetical protein